MKAARISLLITIISSLAACGLRPTVTASISNIPSPTDTIIQSPLPSQTMAASPTAIASAASSETNTPLPSPTPTEKFTPTSTSPSIPQNYVLPSWIIDPNYSVLSMITDVSETTNQLTFLNANTLERVEIGLPSGIISHYFWTIDGKGFGFLFSDFRTVGLVDVTTGNVTKYEIDAQITQCLSEYDKDNRLVVRWLKVYSSIPTDLSFFCPTDNSSYKVYLEEINGESTFIIENIETGRKNEITQTNDGLIDLRYSWSPDHTQIAVLQGPVPDPDDRNPMGTLITIYDITNESEIASFVGQYCSLNWSPDGEKLLSTESSQVICYGDAQPVILYPGNGQIKHITAIENKYHAISLDLFQWLQDSNQFFFVYINPERSDVCIYDLLTDTIFCPTNGVNELNTNNAESFVLSPNAQFLVFLYGHSCSRCDEWGEPSSALIRTDGNNFYPIAKEINRFDVESLNHPYPYFTLLWRPNPVP